MPHVVFEGVTCCYPASDQPAVSDVDLAIADGELVVVHGGPGSGKSTLLRMLAGLVPVTRGRILVDGQELTVGPAPVVSLLFQNYALYPNLTVAENIGLPLTQQGVRKKIVAQRAAEAAGHLDLDGLLARPGDGLTAGQRIRVALARVLVREPAVVLMDEPFANLHRDVRDEVAELMTVSRKRHRTTTVFASADADEALALGDRVALFDGGRLREVVRPGDLPAPPAGQRRTHPGFGAHRAIA
ncbi:MAG TPA: ATP-binding cassette domain-containing protein [Nocardioides sp.]|nr:ATP-binding cassette domain-containing protein [Nocardioides sp.]